MKTIPLPVSLCHANCTKCGLPTEFQLFESGSGGDFATYVGLVTNTTYRLDLGQLHYLHKSKADLLAPAIEQEGGSANLLLIPEQIRCKICGTLFSAVNSMVNGDEVIAAVEL